MFWKTKAKIMYKMMKRLMMEWWEFRVIGPRDWQRTYIEIIMCMWNTRMKRWLGWEITWSRDHSIRICQGHGVAYHTPITSVVASWSILMNDIAHTLSTWCEVVSASKGSHNRVESCTQDMYRHLAVVIMNDILATSGLFCQRFLGMM
jgi:hypothetical protein